MLEYKFKLGLLVVVLLLILSIILNIFLFRFYTIKDDKNIVIKKETNTSNIESFVNTEVILSEELKEKYNKLLLKDKIKATRLFEWLQSKEIPIAFFEKSLDYLLWDKRFLPETYTLFQNLKFYDSVTKQQNEILNGCDSFRYFFYFVDINDFGDYHLYKDNLRCYSSMKDNYQFLSNPLNASTDLIAANNTNLTLHNYKRGAWFDKSNLSDDIKVSFLTSEALTLINRDDFYLRIKEFVGTDSDLIKIFSAQKILSKLWQSLFYEDFSQTSPQTLLRKVSDNFYDYLLIDRSIFRWEDLCQEVQNSEIKKLCDLTLKYKNSKTVKGWDKYRDLVDEYLVYIYNYK